MGIKLVADLKASRHISLTDEVAQDINQESDIVAIIEGMHKIVKECLDIDDEEEVVQLD